MSTAIYTRMKDVRERFGVSRHQVYIWANKGSIQIIQRGRMAFVRTQDLVDIIEGRTPID